MTELSAEDQKLITLAKGARARIGSISAACVRDIDGRTYSGASVSYADKTFSSIDLAIASAIAAGAKKFEAICVLGDETPNLEEIKSVLIENGLVFVCDAQGSLVSVLH